MSAGWGCMGKNNLVATAGQSPVPASKGAGTDEENLALLPAKICRRAAFSAKKLSRSGAIAF
jgi:hypothetical protein